MVNTELQNAVHRAGAAMFEAAALLKKVNPDTPAQNREVLIEIAITAWINSGGSS